MSGNGHNQRPRLCKVGDVFFAHAIMCFLGKYDQIWYNSDTNVCAFWRTFSTGQ